MVFCSPVLWRSGDVREDGRGELGHVRDQRPGPFVPAGLRRDSGLRGSLPPDGQLRRFRRRSVDLSLEILGYCCDPI